MAIHALGVYFYKKQYIPPESVYGAGTLVDWMGKPKWVYEYTDGDMYYYEIAMDEPEWITTLILSDGPPSYIIDTHGYIVGWSPDSGDTEVDVKNAKVLQGLHTSKKSFPVEELMRLLGRD